jgi:hypothetical protein
MREHLGPHLQNRFEQQLIVYSREWILANFRYLQLWHLFPASHGHYCLFVISYVVRSQDCDTLTVLCLSNTNFHIVNGYLGLSPGFAISLTLFNWFIWNARGGCVKVAHILLVCNSSSKFLFKWLSIFFFYLFDCILEFWNSFETLCLYQFP